MTLYEQLLNELKANAEDDYKVFHKKLLKNDKINVLGVRMPTLRRIAKSYENCVDSILYLPDDYYEVTFVKLCAASSLCYEKFIQVVDECVKRIDNWATCDSFKAPCIKRNRDDFISYIEKYLSTDGEFYQRYALTTLLNYYVDREYLEYIFSAIERADTRYYYVHMSAAWLLAEVLVKYYDDGVKFLQGNSLDVKTHNKAIQKARESFRLNEEQKTYLKGLKR
jgi:3-methyladenine DNA glycosylase AlkD